MLHTIGWEVTKINTIKFLREKNNLTQESLAFKMGVDRSTVAKWETGEALPRAGKLSDLAQILQCSIDDLLRKAG